MSDERFVVGSTDVGEIIVTDVETGNVYRYDNIHNFFGLIRLLNEQQSTIERLEKENIELKKLKKYCAEWMGVKEENLSLRCVKMSEKRFIAKGLVEGVPSIWCDDEIMEQEDVAQLLNELSTSCRQLEGEVKSLNAFLVHKGFAEEYIRWKGDDDE